MYLSDDKDEEKEAASTSTAVTENSQETVGKKKKKKKNRKKKSGTGGNTSGSAVHSNDSDNVKKGKTINKERTKVEKAGENMTMSNGGEKKAADTLMNIKGEKQLTKDGSVKGESKKLKKNSKVDKTQNSTESIIDVSKQTGKEDENSVITSSKKRKGENMEGKPGKKKRKEMLKKEGQSNESGEGADRIGDVVNSGTKEKGTEKRSKKKKLQLSDERLKAYGINPKRYKYMKKEEMFQFKGKT